MYPTLPSHREVALRPLHTRLVWYHPLAAGVGTVNTEATVVMTGGLQRSKCHFLLVGRGVVLPGGQHLSVVGTWLPQAQLLSPSCGATELRNPQYPTTTWRLMGAGMGQTEAWVYP